MATAPFFGPALRRSSGVIAVVILPMLEIEGFDHGGITNAHRFWPSARA